MAKQRLNQEQTIRNIMWMCSMRGYSIDFKIFNKKKGSDTFLTKCAKGVEAEIIYQ